MRRTVLVLLAVTGVVAALVVTGSSTMRQASTAGMGGGLVPLALVALLEVVNIAGTWTWLTDYRTRVQVEAAIGVTFASAVSGTCGVLAYGPLGLVAPAGLLGAVHLLNRLLTPDPEPEVEAEAAEPFTRSAPTPLDPSPTQAAIEPTPAAAPSSSPGATYAAPEGVQVPEPQEPAPAPPAVDDEPDREPEPDPEPEVDARVREIAELLAAGADVTGPQAAAIHGVSDRTGRRLLADARTHLEQHPITTTGHGLHLVQPDTTGRTA